MYNNCKHYSRIGLWKYGGFIKKYLKMEQKRCFLQAKHCFWPKMEDFC